MDNNLPEGSKKPEIEQLSREVEDLKGYLDEEIQEGMRINDKLKQELETLVVDIQRRLEELRRETTDGKIIDQIYKLWGELGVIQNRLDPERQAKLTKEVEETKDRLKEGGHSSGDSFYDHTALEVASKNGTSKATLEILAKDIDPEVRIAVVENKNTSEEVLFMLAQDKNDNVRKAVASRDRLPEGVLVFIAADLNPKIRMVVAKRPDFPVLSNAFSHLAQDSDAQVRDDFWLFQYEKFSSKMLNDLSASPYIDVRAQVAGHENTFPDVLAKLAKDKDELVRSVVALNPNVPQKTLVQMANDSIDIVRRAVARNNSTTALVLTKLARDPDDRVRRIVADNPKTPLYAVAKLAKDPVDRVSRLAKFVYEYRKNPKKQLVDEPVTFPEATPKATEKRLYENDQRQ